MGKKAASGGLLRDALRRLVRNRMAVVGAVIVCLMAGAAALAPVIRPFDPEAQERWAGYLPPLTRHPEVAARMEFQTGERWPVPFDALNPRQAALDVEALEVQRLRVIVLAGVVRNIVLTGSRGIERPQRLDVSGADRFLQSDEMGRVHDVALAIDEPLPAVLAVAPEPAERVIVCESARVVGRYLLAVEGADDGTVRSIHRGEEAVDHVVLRAPNVLDARIDGLPLAHRHPLGTDALGRDILSRILYGGRISLLVGVVATLVSLGIGVLYGAIAGYRGGVTDGLMMRFVDILYALPYMFLVIVLLVMFGRNFVILFVALGAVQWLTMARIVRGQVLSLREKEFIEAARTVGSSTAGIIGRHLIPNTLGTVVVYATLTVPEVILQEAFLSFLGLSVQTSDGRDLESWGSLTKSGMDLAQGGHPWLLVFSALALSVTLFSLNFLGDGLRDALDPKLRGKA